MRFLDQFRAARGVSTPLIAVRTFDSRSTIEAIKGALNGKLKETPLVLWDAQHGMRALTNESKPVYTKIIGQDSPEASIAFSETLRFAERAGADNLILFVANAHLQWKDNEPAVIQGIWNLRDTYKANGNMLVLLCNPGAILPTELTNDVLVMDEPLPTLEDLQASVRDTFSFAKMEAPDEGLLTKVTDALIGLPAFPAEQATAMSIDRKTKKMNLKDLWERKRQIISQTPGLSVWQGDEKIDDIGGLESVKDFYKGIMEGNDPPKVIIFMDEIEKAFAGTGTDMSGVKTELTGSMLSWMQDTEMDGSISIGLPGVSKSQLAKAVGGTYGVPVINFDLAGMQSSLVGSSGSNLRAAQATVDAISGGRVLAIATCNSIGALPPELLRRFALGTFFFDAPSKAERLQIWDIYMTKYNLVKQDIPSDEGWTGAEIKECCKKAYRMRKTLLEAGKYIVPVTTSNKEKIASLRHNSSGKYLSASQPGVYQFTEAHDTMDHVPMVHETGRKMREEA